ncbi:MAG: CDP-alcohol phosphatidyltransferase family protein [Ignavibacteriae bacterium]|nr:CDP-alcohol phosphatidyltransferase family protein [Ignavibacteria bacterium]MBI3364582.1 CDP-alcohol phosphatidyltransferase family protein [Ignavibacteriota bacterium]
MAKFTATEKYIEMNTFTTPAIESTYKARDVEETIDIYFYRPLGFWIARACQSLGITPNVVTIVSIFIGVAGGHLLYYRDFLTNVWGIALWIIADTLDSVDGQLARMTNHRSKIGRILDGLGGNIMFLSIYLHLFARMVETYPNVAWPLLLVLTLAGGISHSLQSSLADYYRNAYLKFVVDPTKSELDQSDQVRSEYRSTSFARNPLKKILLRVYLNYTVQQEALSKTFQTLRKRVEQEFGTNIPSWFSDEYRRLNKPLMKYYAALTTNTRMIVMSICVLADVVPVYFVTEIVGINLVMILVTMHQEQLSARLIEMVDEQKVVA